MTDIVKYIFTDTDPEIVEWGDDYIAYNFKNLYPRGLNIFVPGGLDHANYDLVFPKSFEEYFSDMHKETELLSSALEVEIAPNLRDVGIDCLPGKILYHSGRTQAIFRFDELLPPTEKTDLLCRANIRHLMINDKADIYSTRPKFSAEATGPDKSYFYWTMSISQLFRITGGVFAAIFSFTDS